MKLIAIAVGFSTIFGGWMAFRQDQRDQKRFEREDQDNDPEFDEELV